MAKTKPPCIYQTSNYRLFSYTNENRPVKLNGAKRKLLRRSLQAYGWLPAYPMLCAREGGKIVVKDGQHRLALAEELGIPVLYVIDNTPIKIEEINNAQTGWVVGDYAGSFAARGNQNYVELLDFARRHCLPISTCVGLLGNQVVERNLMDHFKAGTFKVKSRQLAERVANLYVGIGAYNKAIKCKFFASALFAVCLVPGLDDKRLLAGAAKHPEMLMKYGSRDGFLDMLERLYNFGRHTKFPVRIYAENALRERNPANRNGTESKRVAAG